MYVCVFVRVRMCVIDGPLIEQHAPISPLSQLSVPWLSLDGAPSVEGFHVHVYLGAFLRESVNYSRPGSSSRSGYLSQPGR